MPKISTTKRSGPIDWPVDASWRRFVSRLGYRALFHTLGLTRLGRTRGDESAGTGSPPSTWVTPPPDTDPFESY
jgi:hypothetical protein